MTYMKMEEMNLYIFSYIRLYVQNIFIPYTISGKLPTDPRFELSAFAMLDKQFKLI